MIRTDDYRKLIAAGHELEDLKTAEDAHRICWVFRCHCGREFIDPELSIASYEFWAHLRNQLRTLKNVKTS